MNRFTADYSSSIGSSSAETPPRSKDLFFNDPTSTTPIVPPPSTVFGSSRFGTGGSKPLFQKSSPTGIRPASPSQRRNLQSRQNGSTTKPKSRLFRTSFNSSIGSTYTKDTSDDHPENDTFDDELDQDAMFGGRASSASLMKFSTNSPMRALARSLQHKSDRNPTDLPNKGQPILLPGLARNLTAVAKPASPEHVDEVILETEVILQQLYDEVRHMTMNDYPQSILDLKVHELLTLWQRHTETSPEVEEPTIGPSIASGLDKAIYVASLLLSLRHPQHGSRGEPVATPRAILDWLEDHHVSYERVYRSVLSHPTNVTAHDMFWEAVLSLTMRGKLQDVMRLLAEADFKYAVTALDDGANEPGYRGSQLQTIQSVIYRARQILNGCPVTASNWSTTSEEWDIYRSNVETEITRLSQIVVEQPEEDDDSGGFPGQKTGMNSLGRQSQAGRSLPLSIFQGVRTMFSILLGSTAEIIAQAQDWLEASCALTMWWDGSPDQNIAKWSADVSRARSPVHHDEPVDPYLGRLRDSFLCVTDPDFKDSFPINALSPIEVGVGCVLQSEIQGVLKILRASSLCVASAIAQVGSAAGWLDDGPSHLTGLDSKDLMVLSYGAGKDDLTKDEILQDYAIALFGREGLRSPEGQSIEGWELSLGILRRLDDTETMHECITDLLNQLDVTDPPRAENIINLCTELDLPEEARKISERFGDHLVNSTTSYGLALLCYAKSHASHKIQQLTDLLISYCLVQSRAYPSEEEMDDGLHSLVDTPKAAFADIAEIDPEAAAHLQFYMVGYACIRRFYQIRDEGIASSGRARTSDTHPMARKRAAAKALVAAINSAADSIYGGLYDSSRQSAIQVDGLLSLLGEATALLAKDSEHGVYTSEQLYALLAAIEDLETVSPRVFAAADECLQAAMRNYAGSLPPSPQDMLKKSMSSGTNSNFSFSLMGSEMLARSGESSGGKSVGSAVLVAGPGKGDVDRGWDWREKFKGQEVQSVGRRILKELRSGIAGELSARELEES